MLSTDPENYPIESGIVPLVFSLCSLRECQPYWSCEGHQFPNGDIKIPQVWFYSRSWVYPKLISEYLVDLKRIKKICNHWHVRLTFAEGLLVGGFSIEPDLKAIGEISLSTMQYDAKIIAEDLAKNLKRKASSYLKRL